MLIIFLGSSLIAEYFNNIYYRNYINSIAPILIPALSIGFGAASATTALKLYLSMQRIHAVNEETDYPVRRRHPAKRSRRAVTAPDISPIPSGQASVVTTPTGSVTLEVKTAQGRSGPVVTAEKKEAPSEPEKPGPKAP